MIRTIVTISILFAFATVHLCADAKTNDIIRSAAELAESVRNERVGAQFDITATVTFPCNPICCTFAAEDDTGAVVMREDFFFPKCPMKAGDRVRFTGGIARYESSGSPYAYNSFAKIISHGPAPSPADSSISELTSGNLVNRLVRFKGVVRDAFVDEIDPLWAYLVIQDGMNSIYACFASQTQQISSLNRLIGAEVRLTGICTPTMTGNRLIERQVILVTGLAPVEVLRQAPADPFEVPPLGTIRPSHASLLSGMDRRCATGRVIAVWHGDRFLLQTKNRQIVRVDLAERNPPENGAEIDAVGNPETDLYHLNLSRAMWRPSASSSSGKTDIHCPTQKPEPVSVSQLLTDEKGRPAVQTQYHGRPIRVKGIVRSLPAPNNPYDRLGLECDKRMIPADASACPKAFADIEIGCVLEVSGICLIETENWRPNAPFPHVDGVALIVRAPEDVRILARPPWWTPRRLMAVIGILFAALMGIFIWNRSLNRLAEKRGRELSEESVAHIAADLKVGERTRLAIELHDALSQNLTGVSLEIATATKLARHDTSQTLQHLDIAARSLKSCRDELRNCIWDLRNCALESPDMNDAVRRTLKPYVTGVELVVRFNVPRKELSDNTTHALLRIMRELVQNAIRHGHAKTIKIAGCLDGESILFSVIDDGCGFDPKNCPGVQQGHFGLQGIRERINQSGGEMQIESGDGKGAKVSIRLSLGQEPPAAKRAASASGASSRSSSDI